MHSARTNVIEVLQLIALKSEKIDLYEEAHDQIFIPEVLLGRWEKVYRPEKPEFEAAFDEFERKQLNCFTDFFLARVNGLPPEFGELLKDPYWSAVCDFAGRILDDFSGFPLSRE